jgi:hypothetical protein
MATTRISTPKSSECAAFLKLEDAQALADHCNSCILDMVTDWKAVPFIHMFSVRSETVGRWVRSKAMEG